MSPIALCGEVWFIGLALGASEGLLPLADSSNRMYYFVAKETLAKSYQSL